MFQDRIITGESLYSSQSLEQENPFRQIQYTEHENRNVLPSIPISVSAKRSFDLGEKNFDFKYVKIKVALKFEVFGKIRNKNARAGVEFSESKDGNVFSMTLKHEIADNLTVQENITPGRDAKLGIKTKLFGEVSFTFDVKLNWTAIFEMKGELPINKTISIGDWLIEGGCKLILSTTIGPNWKNIAWTVIIKKGWNFVRIISSKMITALWVSAAGIPTAVNVAVSTIALSVIAIGVPFYLLFKVFTAVAEGNMLAIAKRYAGGYQTYISHYTIDAKEFSLKGFTLYNRDNDATLKIIGSMAGDENKLKKYLHDVLTQAGRIEQRTDSWYRTEKDAYVLGGAHAMSTLRQFNRLLKQIYGETEVKEMWVLLRKGNQAINRQRKDKGKPVLNSEYYDFIYNQFKDNQKNSSIQGYPLDLHGAIFARSF